MIDLFTNRFCVMFATKLDTTYTVLADRLTLSQAEAVVANEKHCGQYVIYNNWHNEIVLSVYK
jgi:hypothetical protein